MRFLLLLLLCGCGSLEEKRVPVVMHRLIVIPEGSIAIVMPDYMAQGFIKADKQFPSYEIEKAYPTEKR